jgi:cytoskeletal protein RodZ
MNTYFQEALMVVQSEQFSNEFKSTLKFIIRLVNLLFLVIAGLFILVRGFFCRQPKPKQLTEVIEDSNESTNEDSNDVGTLEEQPTSDSTLENQAEVNSTEVDKSVRHKELKLMKASQLRQLCGAYSIGYKNKLTAIESILDHEYSYDGIPF